MIYQHENCIKIWFLISKFFEASMYEKQKKGNNKQMEKECPCHCFALQ